MAYAKMVLKLFSYLLLLYAIGAAQDLRQPVAVVRGGYATDTPEIVAAPGQLFTISIYGLDYSIGLSGSASGLPLPTTLNGISVSIQQGNESFLAPLLSIRQNPCPPSPQPCATLTHIALQIPFELRVNDPASEAISILSYLVVQENGVNRGSSVLRLVRDNIHLADTCDSILNSSGATSGSCRTVVVHADGSYVSQEFPGRPGEYLTIYAFGLGKTSDSVKSGHGTPGGVLFETSGTSLLLQEVGPIWHQSAP